MCDTVISSYSKLHLPALRVNCQRQAMLKCPASQHTNLLFLLMPSAVPFQEAPLPILLT